MRYLSPAGVMVLVKDPAGNFQVVGKHYQKTHPVEEIVKEHRLHRDSISSDYVDNFLGRQPYQVLEKAIRQYGSENVYLASAYMKLENRYVSLFEVRRDMEEHVRQAEGEAAHFRASMPSLSPG